MFQKLLRLALLLLFCTASTFSPEAILLAKATGPAQLATALRCT